MLQLDNSKFEEKLAAMYPPLWQMCWEIKKTFLNHILIDLRVSVGTQQWRQFMIWSRDERVWELDTLAKLSQLIEAEDLKLADNLQDIFDIFCRLDERQIIESAASLDKYYVYEDELPSQSEYANIIHPPIWSSQDEKEMVKFWTIDGNFGNLEEWLFTKREESFSAESWIRKEKFIIPVGRYPI